MTLLNKKLIRVAVILVGILTLASFFPNKIFAAILFQDNFIAPDGTLLSTHDSHWTLKDYEPGTGRWGEYKIIDNKAVDGTGTVFSSDQLSLNLPLHFAVSVNFAFSPNILVDTLNQHFIDIRFNSSSGNQLLTRFWLLLSDSNTIQVYGPTQQTSSLGSYNQLGSNTIKIEYNSGNYTVLINSQKVLQFTENTLIPNYLILNQSVNSAILSHFQIDDLTTPSPTPFPITHFSQRDSLWKDKTYDAATNWSPANPTIERWGCAVTAASTVLDYYGIHSFPGGDVNNPGNLNGWLRSQSDGFFRFGTVNWNAIARASKLASTDNPSIPALEYKYKGNDIGDLRSRLNNLQPVILEEPGHFITAYQYEDGTHATNIIDPFWTETRTTLASYSDTYTSARTFTPSHTNLGYIFSESDPDISSQLYMKNGTSFQLVDAAVSHSQQPLIDPGGTLTPSSQAFQLLEYAQPQDGIYQVHLHRASPGKGTFNIYSYDLGGNPSISPFTSLFGTDDQIITITYTASSSSTIQKNVTFDTLRQDITTARSLHEFRYTYQGTDLLKLLDMAQRLYLRYVPVSRDVMSAYVKVLSARKPLMSQNVFDFINADTQLLLQQLY